jgi:hypothetical protein
MSASVVFRRAGPVVLAGWAAAVGLGLVGSQALACRGCGEGYRPGPAYSAPPVYRYSAFSPPPYAWAYRGRAPGYADFYTTRVNIFRGPRWGYAAAYYNSPRRHAGCRRPVCGHRAYLVGPIVPIVPIARRR